MVRVSVMVRISRVYIESEYILWPSMVGWLLGPGAFIVTV